MESLYAYCLGIKEKMASAGRRAEVFVGFTHKVHMDYRQSKLDRRGYEELRQRMKAL